MTQTTLSDRVAVATTSAADAALTRPKFCGPLIITRYLGPTNYRGSRVVATHKRDSETTWRITLSWDHALTDSQNHQAAAMALVNRWLFGDGSVTFALAARGHDHDCYAWVAVNPEQFEG